MSVLKSNFLNKNNVELNLFNSLTQKKEIFKPIKEKTITWYCCGPTVYDSAHMGHARSYISFDIIRRVLSYYFNYNVIFVMNITDIDDKIIVKARKEHLWEQFSKNILKPDELISTLNSAIINFSQNVQFTIDEDLKEMRSKQAEKFKSMLACLTHEIILNDYSKIIHDFKDVICGHLDLTNGSSIDDHKIFFNLSQKYEKEFLDDIASLGIMKPTFLPKVSECVDDIIKYISVIIGNGFAYESNGSVYFDIDSFLKIHKYAKLMPSAIENINNLISGEGELTSIKDSKEKKSNCDFVLWKLSKPGEPYWISPWGKGRPGWHIECSTMCGNILPDLVDIHSGGVDLKFPHHDNEMAQSEAYYNSHEWIKYFLHTGHLTIDGCKMSKSLKNFITIKQALEKYTSRQIRLAFIMHQWNGPLDFSVNIMNEACQFDKKINDFIMRISSLINENNHTTSYTIIEKQLQNIYIETHENVHIAICDNIDTPKVISQIQLLISATNTYVASKNMENLYNMLLINIIKYIQYIFSIFGADYSLATYSNEDNNLLLQQLAQQVALFRFEIRKIGITENNRDILSLCDSFRDINLFDLGIKLEDKGIDKLSTVMISTPEDLLEEREAEARKKELKKKKKLSQKKEHEGSKERKNVSASIHPSKLFLTQTDKYSQFDQEGIPISDSDGNPLPKSTTKKVMKLYEQQKQLHEKYIAGNK